MVRIALLYFTMQKLSIAIIMIERIYRKCTKLNV